MDSDGNVKGKRRTRTNAQAERKGRVGAARDAVKFAVPATVGWCFSHQELVRDKFTPWEWQVLVARYPLVDYTPTRNSSVVVGRILDMTGQSGQVRKTEDAAHRRARELCDRWYPALRRWQAWKAKKGPRPSKDDFDVLARYNKRSGVKGRKKVEELKTGYLPLADPMDDWRPDADGGVPWRPVERLQDDYMPSEAGELEDDGSVSLGDEDPDDEVAALVDEPDEEFES